MNLDERLSELRKIINSNLLLDIYGARWKHKWCKMFSHFIQLVEQQEIKLSEEDIGNIQRYIEDTKAVILFKPLDDESRNMLRKLLEFLYNVNENSVSKNADINLDILLCIKMLDACMTLNELLGVSREIINKLKESLAYAPPAFKVAEHYLKTLLDEIEEEDE